MGDTHGYERLAYSLAREGREVLAMRHEALDSGSDDALAPRCLSMLVEA